MNRRILSLVATSSVVGAVVGALFSVAPAANAGVPPTMLGPGDANVSNIKDEALIRWSKWGFVYIAGQQHSRLKITFDEGTNTLRYADTGTEELGKIPKSCERKDVYKGIAAVCTVPASFDDKKMFVQVWPRLGNDHVDARTLPARFRLWALVDAGKDRVWGGAGNDFVNGAKNPDEVHGGAGNDWIRTGPGDDTLWGDDGKDKLVCAENHDTAYYDVLDENLFKCEVSVAV